MKKIIYSIIAVLLIALITPIAAIAQNQYFFVALPNDAQDSALSKIQQEISQLSKSMQDKQNELLNLNGELEQSSREIIAIYQTLDQAQGELNEQQIVLNKRIREVYKNSENNNFLALLITADSFNDLWSRISFLARVNQVDRGLLAENKRRLERVKSLKNEIDERKNYQIEIRKQKMKELADLRRSYSLKQVELVKQNSILQANNQQSTFVSEFSLSNIGRQ